MEYSFLCVRERLHNGVYQTGEEGTIAVQCTEYTATFSTSWLKEELYSGIDR